MKKKIYRDAYNKIKPTLANENVKEVVEQIINDNIPTLKRLLGLEKSILVDTFIKKINENITLRVESIVVKGINRPVENLLRRYPFHYMVFSGEHKKIPVNTTFSMDDFTSALQSIAKELIVMVVSAISFPDFLPYGGMIDITTANKIKIVKFIYSCIVTFAGEKLSEYFITIEELFNETVNKILRC